jgi:tetratricopeptide (TPR) repeat protein
MGEVFAAVHEHLDREVALKLLLSPSAEDPQIVARFLQEGRALAQLGHPGVVGILGCDRLDDGTAYLAMELLSGVSLRGWLDEKLGRVALGEALSIARQIADVMVDVHAEGIVHRDLKPENVFLCPDGRLPFEHRVKLLDFGIAKVPPAAGLAQVDTQVQTAAPIFLGTAAYMAPEQCKSAAEVTDRADVYALGVLLFEMLAGRPPFVAKETVEVLSMHMREEPPPLQDIAQATPGALAAFVASMLAKDPVQRPSMMRCCDLLGKRWNLDDDDCPIPGLAPFTEAQAEMFFGRSEEVSEILALLERARTDGRRWVQIEGPSGAGKSSMVHAGLVPRLSEGSPSEPRWLIALLRPSRGPLRELAEALATAYAKDGTRQAPEEIERALRAGADALGAFVAAHTPPGCCVLLVIEQMEELFTVGSAEVQATAALLSSALAAPDGALRLLTTLRSDFLHRVELAPRLKAMLDEAARYHLRTMNEDALLQVVRGMAKRAGLRLSEGLPERMVRDAASEGSRLPLLSHALRGLWTRSRGVTLTHERYEQLGGVGGALARQAEMFLDGLGDEGRERAKWILLDLVQVGRGVPDTRRPATRDEVIAAAGGDRLAGEVLLRLAGMLADPAGDATRGLRLVVLSSESDPGSQRVDLVHEILLHQVPVVAGWIDHERALLERRADLEGAAQTWEQAGYPEEGLPSGPYLARYRTQDGAPGTARILQRMLSPRAARFLATAERLDARRRRQRRSLAGAALAATLVIAASAVYALRERQRAETNLQHIVLATEQIVSEADWALSRAPHTLETRRRMLHHIDENLASLPEMDRSKAEVQRAIIRTKHRLSDLARINESLAQAESFLMVAKGEIELGRRRRHHDADLTRLLALNHSKHGKIALARERWDEARADFARALDLLERLRSDGDDEDLRRTLATSYSEQADLELEVGHPEAAAPFYDRAVSLLEENDGPFDRSVLALALCSRAEAARKAGDRTKAGAMLARAREIQEPLVEASAGNGFFRWTLARIHVELGAFRSAESEFTAALDHHGTAQALARALLHGRSVKRADAHDLIGN